MSLLNNLELIFSRDAQLNAQCKFISEELAQAQKAKKKLLLKCKPNIRKLYLLNNLICLADLHFLEE